MTVYLFLDESGNLDFSPSGTRFYVFGALATRAPAGFSREFSELRYELLNGGVELEGFHATEDRQYVRDRVFSLLLHQVFPRYPDLVERIVLVTDRLPLKRKRQAVEKAFKTFMRQELGERPFSVLHHSSSAHSGLQAADYCTWAVYRKWQAGDRRSYTLIAPFIRTEFDATGAAGG